MHFLNKFKVFAALALILAGCCCQAARRPQGQYRVMTCNIRITGLEADDPYPERVWENRRDLCIQTIKDEKPDFFCLQEVIYDSYNYFVEKFGKDYYFYGFTGPEMDPWTDGYHFIGKNVIFFRKDRFEWVSASCYWLSETPTIAGSVSWETNRARHCNWVRIRDRKTGREMRLVNTHLDHKSDPARREQIKMIMEECALYQADMPQILCGDFNAGIKRASRAHPSSISARRMAGRRCTKISTVPPKRASPATVSWARSTNPAGGSISSSTTAPSAPWMPLS